MTGPGQRPVLPPAAATATQLEAVLADIAERRAQVQALREGLTVFDEQLAALEASLAPTLAWAKAWAGMETAWTDAWTRLPGLPRRPPSPE